MCDGCARESCELGCLSTTNLSSQGHVNSTALANSVTSSSARHVLIQNFVTDSISQLKVLGVVLLSDGPVHVPCRDRAQICYKDPDSVWPNPLLSWIADST